MSCTFCIESETRRSELEELDPLVEAYKTGIDRTLLTRNLALTRDERLRQLQALFNFAAELRAAGIRVRERA